MSAELLPLALTAVDDRTVSRLSSDRLAGDHAIPVHPLDGGTTISVVDELFRPDETVSSVVVAVRGVPGLLSRAMFEFRNAGRLGYGRALRSRRPVSSMVEPGTLVLAHDRPLGQVAEAVLARARQRRYEDTVVL